MNKQTDKPMNKQTDKPMNKQTDKQIGKIDRQIDRHTNRYGYTSTQIDRNSYR